MDAARYASMSDPDNNPNFRRRWGPPPLKVKAPPMGGTTRRGDFETISSNQDIARVFEKFKHLAEGAA